MVRYLRAANVKDGVLDLSDIQSMNFTPAEQRIFSLRPGDVLVTEGSGSLASVGASSVWRGELEGTVCFQNTLLRLRPRQGVDGRYLEWWARSAFGSGVFASIASGANIFHLSAERVRALPLPLPSLDEQGRIADFLDAETARIELLLSKRRQMTELLTLRRERVMEQVLDLEEGNSTRLVPLKYLVREVSVGIVVTPAKWYVDGDGVPALRGLNVQPGRVLVDNLVLISKSGHAENRKSKLHAGDVVVVRTGQAGAAAVVPRELDGANCIDLIIIRLGGQLDPHYVTYVLNSDYAKRQVALNSVGSIQAHFNVGAMKQLPIPDISRSEQAEKVAILDREIGAMDALSERLAGQDRLLKERRQALITAAVTGQLDVTTARPVYDRHL